MNKKDQSMEWVHIEEDADNHYYATANAERELMGSTGSRGRGSKSVTQLVKESIQNGKDATYAGEIANLSFTRLVLTDDEQSDFLDALGLLHKGGLVDRVNQLDLEDNNTLQKLQKDRHAEIELLLIEDQNTCGLGYLQTNQNGEEGRDEFRFDRFMGTGRSRSEMDHSSTHSGRGGSWGVGTQALVNASDCNLILIYSGFESSAEVNYKSTLLYGYGKYDPYAFDGTSFVGRSFFGVPGLSNMMEGFGEHVSQKTPGALVDENEAGELGFRLGFLSGAVAQVQDPRSEDLKGTSVIIIGPKINMEDVKKAVEQWWWPLLSADGLAIDLSDSEIDYEDGPKIQENDDLASYVACFEWLQAGAKEEDLLDNMEHHEISVSGGDAGRGKREKMGDLVLYYTPTQGVEEADDAIDDEKDDLEEEFEHGIALIREGPKMVVEYYSVAPNVTGVFMASGEADDVFKASEPPAHNKWDVEQDALREDFPERGKNLVTRTLRRIRNHSRAFAKAQEPELEPTPSGGSRELQQLMAPLGVKKPGPPPPPPKTRDPWHINGITEELVPVDDGHHRIRGRCKISLQDDFEEDTLIARFAVQIQRMVDDSRGREKITKETPAIRLETFTIDGEEHVSGDGIVELFKQETGEREVEYMTESIAKTDVVLVGYMIDKVNIFDANGNDDGSAVDGVEGA